MKLDAAKAYAGPRARYIPRGDFTEDGGPPSALPKAATMHVTDRIFPARGRRRLHVAGLAAMVGLGAVALAAVGAEAQAPPTLVQVAQVEARVIQDTAPVIGRVVSTVESAVAARVAGVVLSVSVSPGDRLLAGEEIARIDEELLEIDRRAAAADLERAAAGVDVARAQLDLATQTLERAASLQGSTAFSRSAFEDQQQRVAEARSALARAEADVARAEAALARAAYNLGHARIVAPFDGAVLSRAAQPGQFIERGAAAAMMIDLAALEIEVDLPAALVDRLSPGAEVSARLGDPMAALGDESDASGAFTLVLRSIVPLEAASTRTRPARFVLADPSTARADLIPGAAVTVFAPIGDASPSLLAPKDALASADPSGAWVVFVVADGRAEPRLVRIGRSEGDRVEVLDGLAAGEMVVVRGNERLRPGQAVTATPVAPADGDADAEAPDAQAPAATTEG